MRQLVESALQYQLNALLIAPSINNYEADLKQILLELRISDRSIREFLTGRRRYLTLLEDVMLQRLSPPMVNTLKGEYVAIGIDIGVELLDQLDQCNSLHTLIVAAPEHAYRYWNDKWSPLLLDYKR